MIFALWAERRNLCRWRGRRSGRRRRSAGRTRRAQGWCSARRACRACRARAGDRPASRRAPSASSLSAARPFGQCHGQLGRAGMDDTAAEIEDGCSAASIGNGLLDGRGASNTGARFGRSGRRPFLHFDALVCTSFGISTSTGPGRPEVAMVKARDYLQQFLGRGHKEVVLGNRKWSGRRCRLPGRRRCRSSPSAPAR